MARHYIGLESRYFRVRAVIIRDVADIAHPSVLLFMVVDSEG